MTVRHIFLWRVAEGHSGDKVAEMLSVLSEQLPQVASWELGQHKGDPGDNGAPWDGALISDFNSWEDLAAYSDDPEHLELVTALKPMVADRAVVDFDRVDHP